MDAAETLLLLPPTLNLFFGTLDEPVGVRVQPAVAGYEQCAQRSMARSMLGASSRELALVKTYVPQSIWVHFSFPRISAGRI